MSGFAGVCLGLRGSAASGFPSLGFSFQVRAQFRKALDKRINSRGGNDADNEPMDIELVRDARALDDMLQRRIRVYQFATPMMRARFGHLLARHDD